MFRQFPLGSYAESPEVRGFACAKKKPRAGNDLRDIETRATNGDEACRLAIQVFAHRVRKYIGAYAAVMGGVDAIVFTAGIGQNSALMRHRIAQR